SPSPWTRVCASLSARVAVPSAPAGSPRSTSKFGDQSGAHRKVGAVLHAAISSPASCSGADNRRRCMLARYIKAQIIVLVCGGLVGPIFLVTYFVLPNMLGSFGSDVGSMAQQTTQWMLWVGLLITIADVLVALWLANRGAQSSAKSAALHQTGVLTM